MLGIGLDFYLVARVILGSRLPSAVLAAAVVGVFAVLWFGLPRAMNDARAGH
jgi:hypothetical protein